jgi:hypothetical protein
MLIALQSSQADGRPEARNRRLNRQILRAEVRSPRQVLPAT